MSEEEERKLGLCDFLLDVENAVAQIVKILSAIDLQPEQAEAVCNLEKFWDQHDTVYDRWCAMLDKRTRGNHAES